MITEVLSWPRRVHKVKGDVLPLVLVHPAAGKELAALPSEERAAMQHALEKLEALGSQLPFPHQSAIRGAPGIRELRPRAGRSPWRGFFTRVGNSLVLLAIGPEAEVDRKEFQRAVAAAQARLAALEA
jgi:hypothetical protein